MCVLIKPISLLFSPLFIFIIYKRKFSFIKTIPKSKYIIISLLFFTLISSSFFKTGCLFYPINSTCFSQDKIFWSEKARVNSYSEMVSLWAKSYWAQDGSKYEKVIDKDLYNKNFKWLKFWIEKHFFYTVFEFLIIVIVSIIIIYIYFTREKSRKNQNLNDKIILLFLSITSLFLWLILIPQFRFGFALIIIFIYIILDIILRLKVIFNKKKFFYLLIFALIILNTKNLNRIHNEFQRNDIYKFSNFPFYNEIKIDNNYSK